MHTKLSSENLKVRNHLGHLDIDVRIILKLILQEDGVDWIQQTHDRIQWRALVHGNEPPCSIKCGEFLDQLSDYELKVIG
jgi:hypothetical protein